MIEVLKLVIQLMKERKEEAKYRAKLLDQNLNVDAFDYFLKKAAVTGVKVTMVFADGHKVEIEREEPNKVNYKSFSEQYKEAKIRRTQE